MSDETAKAKADTFLVRGQTFKFMPIPMIENNAEWFDAGPVSFAVEVRVLAETDDHAGAGGGSIHVFSADRTKEFVRFDCFDDEPHYHYLNQREHLNTVWSFDPGVNGPMAPWALSAIRRNLPAMLRSAGADDEADRVERDGYDTSVFAGIEKALVEAQQRSVHDAGLVAESAEWFRKWKENNPDLKLHADQVSRSGP